MGYKFSIKAILTFNFIMVVTLPIILISSVTLVLLTRNLEQEITNKQMYLARSLSAEIEWFLNEQQSVLALVDDYINNQSQSDPAHVSDFLDSIINNYQFFDMLQIVDNSGEVTGVAPYRNDYIGINISGFRFFKTAKRLGAPYWSSIFISYQTKQPTIAVTHPLPQGMVVGYLNLARINDMVDRVYLGDHGWVQIVDRDGTNISHTIKSHVYERVNIRNHYIVRQGLRGYPGSYRYYNQGEEILANVTVITQTGWPIILCQPSQDAFAQVRIARNVFLSGSLIALMLAIMIALGSVEKIYRPLAGFAKWAREVATGNYAISLGKNHYREFDELAEDFKMMTGAIQSREQALRDSEERYALSVLGAHDGLWDWDMKKRFFYLSPRLKEILGYEDDEGDTDPKACFKRIHPDDLLRVWKDLKDHLKGISPHFHNEFRILHQDGSYFWVLARGIAVRNLKGHLYRMAGSITDISERRRHEEQIIASLKEKELLLREIHHRVKNNMQVISSLLRLQSSSTDDRRYTELMKECQNRIHTMSLVHEKLYQSNDLARIDFRDYLENLIHSLFRSYAVSPDKVELQLDVADIKAGIDTAIPCGLIINELVTNALKYAFPNGHSGWIRVGMWLRDDAWVELIVEDNGVGLPDDFDPNQSESLGLQLVSVLVKDQLQGELEVIRKDGTLFKMIFREDE